MHHEGYTAKLEETLEHADFSTLTSFDSDLSWTHNTSPDLFVLILRQVTDATFVNESKRYSRSALKLQMHFKSTENLTAHFSNLAVDTLFFSDYSNASCARNTDLSWEFEYIIFFADKSATSHPIRWSLHIAKMFTKFDIGSFMTQTVDAFDIAWSIKYDRNTLIEKEIPIKIFTDSLSYFEILTKATVAAENPSIIDLYSAKTAFGKKKVAEITYIRWEYIPADALKKPKGNESFLNTLQDSYWNHPNEKWIILEKDSESVDNERKWGVT